MNGRVELTFRFPLGRRQLRRTRGRQHRLHIRVRHDKIRVHRQGEQHKPGERTGGDWARAEVDGRDEDGGRPARRLRLARRLPSRPPPQRHHTRHTISLAPLPLPVALPPTSPSSHPPSLNPCDDGGRYDVGRRGGADRASVSAVDGDQACRTRAAGKHSLGREIVSTRSKRIIARLFCELG